MLLAVSFIACTVLWAAVDGAAQPFPAIPDDDSLLQAWQRGRCSEEFSESETVSFTLYLKPNENYMRKHDADVIAELAEHFPRGLDFATEAEKLAKLRDLFAPRQEHSDAVSTWLGPLTPFCSLKPSKHAISCNDAPAAEVFQTLFSRRPGALCYYTPIVGSLPPMHDNMEQLRVHPLHVAAALEAGSVASYIAHVEGLPLHDHRLRPTRHRHGSSAEHTPRKSADTNAAASGRGGQPALGQSSSSSYVWPQNGSPVMLSLQQDASNVTSVIVAVVCSDGTYPVYGELCNTNPVVMISVRAQIAGGPISQSSFQLNDSSCVSAYEVITVSETLSSQTVCQVELDAVVPYFSGYDSVQASAFLTYSDGTTSSIAYTCLWNNGLQYGNCNSESTASYSYPRPNMISDIRSLYGVPNISMSSTMNTGVIEWATGFEENVFLPSDVVTFMYENGMAFDVDTQLNLSYYYINSTQGETTLDVDLVAGLVPGGTITLWSLYTSYYRTPLGQWLNMIEELLAAPSAFPQTAWSVSWTFGDPRVQSSAAELLSARFRLLSLAGITVVAASGDQGAGMGPGTSAVLQFPDSSPYCLSVGATAIKTLYSFPNERTEVVCSSSDGNVITSGGGYSTLFEPGSYQTGATGRMSGRGAPDVSALGANIRVWLYDEPQLMFGTSASTPIIASLISLLNAERKSVGKSGLPLVHYFLYNSTINGNFFNDVTRGSNCAMEASAFPWLGTSWYSASNCYQAGPGWDAVTGWGTPRFNSWRSAAIQWSPSFIPPPSGTYSVGSGGSGSGFVIPGLSHVVSVAVIASAVVLVSSLTLLWVRMRRRRQVVYMAPTPTSYTAQALNTESYQR